MDPVLDGFRATIEGLTPLESPRRFVSSVIGSEISCDALGTDYWADNLRQPVRFVDALKHVYTMKTPALVEVSPHPSLGHAISEVAADCDRQVLHLATLRREQPAETCLLRTLGELFVRGHPVEFEEVRGSARVVSTPPYPYQKKELWFAKRRRRHVPVATHPLLGLGRDLAEVPGARIHESILDHDTTASFGFADDDPSTLVPPGLALETALAAGAERFERVRLTNVRFSASATPQQHEAGEVRWTMQTTLDAENVVRIAVRTPDREDAAWRQACEATSSNDGPSDTSVSVSTLDVIRERCAPYDAQLARTFMKRAGATLPKKLDGIREIWTGDREVLARIGLPGACQNEVGHNWLNPLFFENAVALAAALLEPRGGGTIATEAQSVAIDARSDEELFVHTRLEADDRAMSFDFYAGDGHVRGTIERLLTRPHANADRRTSHVEFDALDEESRIKRFRLTAEPGHGSPTFIAHLEANPPTLDPGMVEIDVRAARFSRTERASLRGGSRSLNALGCEVAGVVRRIGPNVTRLTIGDRVFGFASGALASDVVAPADGLSPMPRQLSFDRAASLPVSLATAERAMGDLTMPSPGERVLLLDGDEDVASALTAIASRIGAQAHCVASSADHAERLIRLGAAAVAQGSASEVRRHLEAWRRHGPFASGFVTGAGRSSFAQFDLVSPSGSWVVCSPLADFESSGAGANVSILRVSVDAMCEERVGVAGEWLRRGVSRFETTREIEGLTSSPIAFPIGEVDRALTYAAQQRGAGPVIVSFDTPVRLDRIEIRERVDREERERTHVVLANTDGDKRFATQWRARHGGRVIQREASASIDHMLKRIDSITCVARDVADLDRVAEWLDASGAQECDALAILYPADGGEALAKRADALCTGSTVVRREPATQVVLEFDGASLRSPAGEREIESALERMTRQPGRCRATFTGAPLPRTFATESQQQGHAAIRDRAALQAFLEEHVSSVLALGGDAVERLRGDTSLIDLGLDSLLGRELALHLENAAGLSFEPRVWAARPSLGALVEIAAANLGFAEGVAP